MTWSSHDLGVSWLNDHAAAFRPSTLKRERCEPLVEHPALIVLGFAPRDVFVMTLRRAEPADLNDMCPLRPPVNDDFAAARHIVAAFYEALAHEPAAESLAEFVVAELARGGINLPLQ